MAKIQPVVFPFNLGTANELIIRTLPFTMDDETISLIYELRDTTIQSHSPQSSSQLPFTILNSGRLIMDKETYSNWGVDNIYVVNWVAEKLGVILIVE